MVKRLHDDRDSRRTGDGFTQEEVASLLGVSRERVGQIERKVLRMIRVDIEREAEAKGKTVRQMIFGE